MKKILLLGFVSALVACNIELRNKHVAETTKCRADWQIYKTKKEFNESEKNLSHKYKFGISISPKQTCNIDETAHNIIFDYYASDAKELPSNQDNIINIKIMTSGFWTKSDVLNCSRHRVLMRRTSGNTVNLEMEATCNSPEVDSNVPQKISISGEFEFREYL